MKNEIEAVDTAIDNTVEKYFDNDKLRIDVWKGKYALHDKQNNQVEFHPEDTLHRVSDALASVNKEDKKKAQVLYRNRTKDFKHIVPQGSILSGAGNTYQLMSLSNCTVIDSPEDSIEGIGKSITDMAQLMKRRCGVGVDLSTLRPKNSSVNNAARTSTGAASWANIFSDMCRAVGQGGRRGALMLTLNINHPDAEEWCLMKQDLTKVTGANVSLKITDDFMNAVINKKSFVQKFIDTETGKVVVEKEIDAEYLWNIIVKCAWTTAEPGILMWDNIISTLPADCYEEFKSISTNPCSEIPLSKFDSCRLISICLAYYVKNKFEKNAEFDFEQFEFDVRTMVRMSDDLVELELQHIKKIIDSTESKDEKQLWKNFYEAGKNGRRVGNGTHGLADCLIYLGLRYDSDEAISFCDKLYTLLKITAYDESVELAIKRGAFPLFDWEKEKSCKFYQSFPKKLLDKMKAHGRRNISLLTMAPTGSISIMSGVSSGIEPNFRHFYTRRRKINQSDHNATINFVDSLGDKWEEYPILSYSTKSYSEYFNISPENIAHGKHKLPKYFVTSDEINHFKRIEIQSIIQSHIDHSISSTINLPSDVSEKNVSDIYIESWKKGLKGVTVYRDGSRSGVLVANDKKEIDTIQEHNAPKRPEELPCDIHHIKARGEDWIALVGLLNGKPYEIFAGRAENVEIPKQYVNGKIVKKKGSYWLYFNDNMTLNIKKCFDDVEGDLTRILSLSLRHGAPIEYIVIQLEKVKGNITDLSQAIKRVLKKYVNKTSSLKCIECGETAIVMEDGCFQCKNCGSTKCS